MIVKEIEDILKETLEELNYQTDCVEVKISNRKDLCDYQYDGLFKLAKEIHRSPMEIGNALIEKLTEKNLPQFAKIEFFSPGFINFTLSDAFINHHLNEMWTHEKFAITFPKPQKIFMDYGGPNIAKPLHVGHLRSAIVGEAIKRILKYMGHEVICDVHLGDYGLQIGEVIYGLKEKNMEVNQITLKDLETIYPDMSKRCNENEDLKEKCAKITKDLQDGNEEYQIYFKKIKELSSNDILKIYKYLDVSFDLWLGESDAYPYIPLLTKELEKRNLLKESEGAKIIDVKKDTDLKELPPFIYQKKNKAYLYSTTDLAAIYERMEKYHPDTIIYVTDYRQKLHFTTLFRVCEKLDYTKKTTFEHIAYGTVNGKDGHPYKTRNGLSPKLEDLLKEVKETFKNASEKNKDMKEKDLDIITNAIVKFADLQNNWEKDYVFDITKFSSVVGKTGPYILYTYLRVQSILRKENLTESSLNQKIYDESDRNLRIKMLELDSILNYAMKNRLPSVLANYLYELCVNVNAFYEKNHINTEGNLEKKQNWIFILNLSNNILKSMLDLLSIQIPERM